MIKITKKNPPKWYTSAIKEQGVRSYKQLYSKKRRQLREELIEEQHKLCAYCCGKLNIDYSIIEHIKPQSLYPELTLDYRNMVASCKGYKRENSSCGIKKQAIYDEKKFISPLEKDVEENFRYLPNGTIEGLNERARYTIEVLNLNSHHLRMARKAVFEQYLYMDRHSKKRLQRNETAGKLPAFVNVIRFVIKNRF